MRQAGWLIVALWPLAALAQAPAQNSTTDPDTLAGIKAEAARARESFLKEIRRSGEAASDSEARAAAVEVRHARLLNLMDRALTLARSHPREAEGVDAAAWVATETIFVEGDDVAERGDAAYRLLADAPALDDADLFGAVVNAEAVGLRAPGVEPFLRSVISRSRSWVSVNLARLHLGLHLAEMARMRDRLTAPISGPELMSKLTKNSLERCRAIDGPKFRSEAEALLEQVVREDAKLGSGLGEDAEDELYRIRRLRIGQPAPELVGEDINGAPIRLSDFRGKVVVLLSWSASGDSHMRWIRRQKDLVAAMKGRPFTLVGVNSDAEGDRAKAKEVVAKEGITWRSFWTGGPDGEIPRKWGVGRLPTAYVIDANGIIRDDQVGESLAPTAFSPLVQAAEEAAR